MYKLFYIYLYKDLLNKEIFYVGKGKNKRYRIKPHLMHSPNIQPDIQVLDIRNIDFSKMKLKEKEKFAKSLNVSWTTIYDVINRRTWKHI